MDVERMVLKRDPKPGRPFPKGISPAGFFPRLPFFVWRTFPGDPTRPKVTRIKMLRAKKSDRLKRSALWGEELCQPARSAVRRLWQRLIPGPKSCALAGALLALNCAGDPSPRATHPAAKSSPATAPSPLIRARELVRKMTLDEGLPPNSSKPCRVRACSPPSSILRSTIKSGIDGT